MTEVKHTLRLARDLPCAQASHQHSLCQRLTLTHCVLQLVHEDVQARARAGSQGRSGAGSGPATCRMSTDDRDPLFSVALPEGAGHPHSSYTRRLPEICG